MLHFIDSYPHIYYMHFTKLNHFQISMHAVKQPLVHNHIFLFLLNTKYELLKLIYLNIQYVIEKMVHRCITAIWSPSSNK